MPGYDSIVDHVITKGLPLVLTNTSQDWDRELFSWHKLKELIGDTQLEGSPRDNDSLADLHGWTVSKYYYKLLL